jgi:cyclopropane-fatty-acyl-phospholipid synthase
MAIGATVPWPDSMTRAGIRWLVARTDRQLAMAPANVEFVFSREMLSLPVATHTENAKAQHYEVPTEFFELVLGPQRKYSCCLFADDSASLASAEEAALAATAKHADLADGQRILELGCGWGSLSLWMARRYPAARIVAVSNSRSQCAFIMQKAQALGLVNLHVITADMNTFSPTERFDRVVSVEMFEHMANWCTLLARIRSWLELDGRLFLHVFSHRCVPYRFDHENRADWIAQHFFTGGIMPSHGLIRQFADNFAVEQEWRWSGEHYRRTAEAWLANFDAHSDAIGRVLDHTYGVEASVWRRRWRLFLLATIGLFGYADGASWGVSHYRLAPH